MTPLEAYNILLQRQMNEDRVLGERTSMFLVANSFLFLAFATLLMLGSKDFFLSLFRALLPGAGIFLSFVLYGINRAAVNAMDFWHIAQRKIEETSPAFYYMRQKEITPHVDADKVIWGGMKWDRNNQGKWALVPTKKEIRWLMYPILLTAHQARYFPPILLVLWIAALIVAIIAF